MGREELPRLVVGPVPAADLGRGLEAAVDADVDDDAGRPQRLPVQPPHPVAGVVQIAELGHQPLGIQGPALAVAGGPGLEAAPLVEQLGAEDGLGDLEVMARDPLVVDGRQLLPRPELVDALGHGPPHPSRPAEVVARAGVVDAAGLGRGDQALDPADRPGDVEVDVREVGDDLVRLALHPGLEGVLARQQVGGVGVEDRDGLLGRGPRPDLSRDLTHLGVDRGDLLLTPAVSFLEIDCGADEVAREEGIALPPAGVASGRGVQQLGSQEGSQAAVCRGRPVGGRGQGDPDVAVERGVAGRGAGDEVREVPVGGGELRALLDARRDLALRGDVAPGPGSQEGFLVLLHGCRDLGHSRGERGPRRLAVLRHEVEDGADVL